MCLPPVEGDTLLILRGGSLDALPPEDDAMGQTWTTLPRALVVAVVVAGCSEPTEDARDGWLLNTLVEDKAGSSVSMPGSPIASSTNWD